MRKEVNQKQAELQAIERQGRVQAALAGQMPRLQRWQSMKVKSILVLLLLFSLMPTKHAGGSIGGTHPFCLLLMRMRCVVSRFVAEPMNCLKLDLSWVLSSMNAEGGMSVFSPHVCTCCWVVCLRTD